MRRGNFCWYCRYCSGHAQRKQHETYTGKGLQLLRLLSQHRTVDRSAPWSVYLEANAISPNSLSIGGILERPAAKYTSTFGRIQFFHNYPYALPGFVTSLIALSAAITTSLFVKEVCAISKDKRHYTNLVRHYTYTVARIRQKRLPCQPGSFSTTRELHGWLRCTIM
jgi:hypothetical protein